MMKGLLFCYTVVPFSVLAPFQYVLYVQGLCQRVPTLEALLEKRENELRTILNDYGADRSEAHKLARAMHNLKRYTGKSAVLKFCLWGVVGTAVLV